MSRQRRGSNLMDPQCIALCNAINSVPGLKTTSSCSGHNKQPMFVEIEWRSPLDLMILCHAIRSLNDRRRRRCFIFNAEVTDVLWQPVEWFLESTNVGRRAYDDAEQLALDIESSTKHILEWRAREQL